MKTTKFSDILGTKISVFRWKMHNFRGKIDEKREYRTFLSSHDMQIKTWWPRNFCFVSQEIYVRKIKSRISFRMIQGFHPVDFSILTSKIFLIVILKIILFSTISKNSQFYFCSKLSDRFSGNRLMFRQVDFNYQKVIEIFFMS